MFVCQSTSKKRSSDQLFQNMNYLRLRLTFKEKSYYTNLFMEFKDPNTGHVLFENFPKLLGILGTDIAEDIAQRIFEIFSGNKNFITLAEYLKYIDVYHYGDKNERSNLTCKLMDFNHDGQITFNEFYKYINLIIGAVRKVNPYLKSELFSKDDINVLFNKISNNKDYFTYDEFFIIYNEKPEIISWIDYFKNDSDDSLLVLNKYIKKIIKNFCKFNKDIINIFKNQKIIKNLENEKKIGILDIDKIGLLVNDIKNLLNEFEKELKLENEKFMNFAKKNDITLRNLISILSKKDEEIIFEDEGNNINTNLKNNKNIRDVKDKIINNKKKSVNLFNINNDNNDTKVIANDSKTNNIMIRKSIRLQTIKNFFDDIKHKLNSECNLNNKIITKSQSICPKDFFFKNKFAEKEYNVSNFKFEEEKNLKSENKKDESSGYTDFIISEEDDEGIIGKNINVLNHETFFQIKYSKKRDNSKNNLQNNINKVTTKETEENKKNLEESTKEKTLKDLNGILIDKSNSIKTDITDKNTEKYTSIIFNLFKHLETFTKIFLKSMINLNESYKYIESKYLKNDLINMKRIKKEEHKKALINKIKAENKIKDNLSQMKSLNKKSVSTAVENIPKTKLKTSDDSFKILLNTIMGIQIAVESSPDIAELQNINQYLHSMSYSIQTSNISKNKHESFMIKEYAGIVFNNIRRLYNYDKESFIQSISPQVFITEIIISNTTSIEEFFNTGSSGSLFYYTRDGKFILKTIDKKEYKTLKRILPKYYLHLAKYKYTFLPKIFGYYKLIRKVKKKKTNFYFIIMMNVFSTKKKIHLRFDLKGSKLGREVLKQKEKNKLDYEGILGKYNYALKDLDFDFFKKEIHIDSEIRDKIIEQLKIDSLLLRELNINDYSLLLGIHKKKMKKKFEVNNSLNNKNNEDNIINNNNNNGDNIINNINDNNVDNIINNNIQETKSQNIDSNASNFSFSSKEQEDEENINHTDIKIDFSSERATLSNCNKSFTENKFDKSETSENRINNIEKFTDDKKGIILEDGGFLNKKENEIYYFGIIDILTNYDCIKVGEFVYKSIRYCSKKMSCISPGAYQQRFMNYLTKIIPPNYNKDENNEEN